MLRILILLLIAAPALAEPPRWAMPVLADGLAAHRQGDFGRARGDFLRLAHQGSAIAETMLGVMASHGEAGPRDATTAAAWWLRAANRGYAPAQLAVAQAFVQGAGVTRDDGTALMWTQLAALHGDAIIAARAGTLATVLQARLTAGQRAEVERRRAAWRPWASLG